MKKIIFIFILASCTDDTSSREALEKAGFSDISITGFSPFSCSDDDFFSTGFNAKNPKGVFVSGTVCCGIFKSCTIRY